MSIVSLIGLLALLTVASTTSCASRRFNGSQAKAEDPLAPPAVGDGLLSSRPWLEKFVKQIREEAEGAEDFTWDIDCPEVPEISTLKFTADPAFRFDLADGSPAHAPSLANAIIMARASFLTYKKSSFLLDKNPDGSTWPGREPRAWGFTKAEFLSDPTTDVQAFVFSNEKTILVVFRGTASLLDLIVDLDLVKDRDNSWGEVHRGFSIAYGGRARANGIQAQMFEALARHGYDVNLWRNVGSGVSAPGTATDERGFHTDLETKVRETPSKELWITGHSAGGALAQLMAADLTEREAEFRGLWGAQRCQALVAPTSYVAGVVSFGSPRLGDAAFAQCMNAALKGRNWRFVSNTDIVAQIPWAEFGYRHAGENLYLTDGGQLRLNPPLLDMAQDMGKAIFGRFVRGELLSLGKGVQDHFVYPQPIQHQYDNRCSHKRGVKPTPTPAGS